MFNDLNSQKSTIIPWMFARLLHALHIVTDGESFWSCRRLKFWKECTPKFGWSIKKKKEKEKDVEIRLYKIQDFGKGQ